MAANSLRLAGVSLLVFLSTIPLSAYGYSKDEKQELVDRHNEFRRKEPASNMLKMVWDAKVERIAKKHAAKCLWEHSKILKHTGENLFANPGKSFPAPKPISAWENEIRFYNYAKNTCEAKKACGHYTQVVWASSYKLGCATKYCANLKKLGKKISIVVCNYQPAGNYRGASPYKKGTACSQCPSGAICEKKLCVITGHSHIFKGGKLETIISILAFVLLTVLISV